MNIRKGDNVIVISGKDKGKTGKIEKAFPKKNQVIIAQVNMHKKHQRPTKSGSKGQIIDKAFPVDVSNVMLEEAGKPARIGFKMVGEKKVRISKKTGKEI